MFKSLYGIIVVAPFFVYYIKMYGSGGADDSVCYLKRSDGEIVHLPIAYGGDAITCNPHNDWIAQNSEDEEQEDRLRKEARREFLLNHDLGYQSNAEQDAFGSSDEETPYVPPSPTHWIPSPTYAQHDNELEEGRRILEEIRKTTKRRRLRHCRNIRRIDSDTEDENAGKYIDEHGHVYEYQELSD